MKILSITGSRSDYSLMRKLFHLLAKDPVIEHHLAVTGMLLNSNHIDILSQIKQDQLGTLHFLPISEVKSDSAAMSSSLGEMIISLTQLLNKVSPDILLLQGDRGEMLAGAIAAAHLNILIVHLSGGDRSGSIDDSIRNAISKFSHLHFVTCEDSAQNLLKMAESAARIHIVGEPGVDVAMETSFLSDQEIQAEFGIAPGEKFLLACQHPVTTEVHQTTEQIETTLAALRETNIKTVFTYPNNDAGSEFIIQALEKHKNESWIQLVKNLGSRKFLSLLRRCLALVGNSSSGIWEAPTFHIPVVNIGTRQFRRFRAGNVLDVPHNKEKIKTAIVQCVEDRNFLLQLQKLNSPYGDGNSSEKILTLLKSLRWTDSFKAKWLDEL